MIHKFNDLLDFIVDFQKARSRLRGADRTRAKSGFIGIQSSRKWTQDTGLHAKDNRVKNLVALHKCCSDRGAVVDIPKSLRKIMGRDIEERFCPVCRPPGRNEHPSTKCSRAWNTINWLYDLANAILTIVVPVQDAKNTENKNGRSKRSTGPQMVPPGTASSASRHHCHPYRYTSQHSKHVPRKAGEDLHPKSDNPGRATFKASH